MLVTNANVNQANAYIMIQYLTYLVHLCIHQFWKKKKGTHAPLHGQLLIWTAIQPMWGLFFLNPRNFPTKI